MIKEFSNYEVLALVNFINQLTPEKNAEMGLKLRWAIRKASDQLTPIANRYEEFRDKLINELRLEWFTEDKTDETTQVVTDSDGNPVLDADGNEQTEPALRIKDELIADYQKAVEEVNTKLNEIGWEKNEVEIDPFNIDAFVDKLDEDTTHFTYEDLNMLTFLDNKTNVKEAD